MLSIFGHRSRSRHHLNPVACSCKNRTAQHDFLDVPYNNRARQVLADWTAHEALKFEAFCSQRPSPRRKIRPRPLCGVLHGVSGNRISAAVKLRPLVLDLCSALAQQKKFLYDMPSRGPRTTVKFIHPSIAASSTGATVGHGPVLHRQPCLNQNQNALRPNLHTSRVHADGAFHHDFIGQLECISLILIVCNIQKRKRHSLVGSATSWRLAFSSPAAQNEVILQPL